MTRHQLVFSLAVAGLLCAPLHRTIVAAAPPAPAASPCAAQPDYQRLAFWVGDWEVLDDKGAHYATQRVRTAVDACAITAEWSGRAGDKGLSVSAFDRRSGEWRQVYVSNQVPSPTGVHLRKSDPSYSGPGVRFIPLLDPTDGSPARSRVTIMPLNDKRAMQLFEDSSDGGKTWHTQFQAEHRPLRTGEP